MRNLRTKRRLARLPPRATLGPQSVSGDHPIERHQVFGNIVTAVYNVAAGVRPAGLVQ
jgi:hypothetical protein